ncbi:MAG: hypothetical protein M3Q66_09935, partial [Chloroflexota bacterium]|nr:hypothetical protein [Chloroflexota bacterium]
MIRCTSCQTINPSDSVLCSNCSSLLEWTGVPVDPSEPTPPLASDVAAEAKAADEARVAAEAKAADE